MYFLTKDFHGNKIKNLTSYIINTSLQPIESTSPAPISKPSLRFPTVHKVEYLNSLELQ